MDNLKIWERGEKAWSWYFLSTYNLAITLGFVIAFLSVAYFWRRQKYPWEHLQILLIIIVPTSLLGARVWFILFPPKGVETDWADFFNFRGLAIQGAVMMATISASIYAFTIRHVINYRIAFGMILPAVMVGQAIGRWGNFHNHEVFGAIIGKSFKSATEVDPSVGSSLDWLTFIKPHMLIKDEFNVIAYRQPFFFYESMLNFLGYFTMMWILLRKNYFKPGTSGAIYFIWYGIVRAIMEPLRDEADIMKWGNVNLSQLTSIFWIMLGLGLFCWFQGFTKPFDKWFKWILPTPWLKHLDKNIKREYEAIYPIKKRKKLFFGEQVDYVHKYLFFYGPKRINRVKIWIPKVDKNKWSKREINKGKKA